MKKKLLAFIMALSLSLGAIPAYAQTIIDSPVKVTIYSMPFDTELKAVDTQLYISARDAATLLGAGISWDANSKTVIIYETNHTLVFTVGQSGYYNNAIQMYSLNKPVIINEKCYISLIDVLNGAGRRYSITGSDSINVLNPLGTDENSRTILTSDEYAQQYLYNKPSTGYYTPTQPNNYEPSYSYKPNYSYNQAPDYEEYYERYTESYNKYMEAAEQAKADAEQRMQNIADLESQLNNILYEQACRDAYVKYMKELQNASTYGSYASAYADGAKQEYEAELERLKNQYGM